MERLTEQGFDLSRDDCSAMSIVCPAPEESSPTRVPPKMNAVETLARMRNGRPVSGVDREAACGLRLLLMEHGANIVEHGRPPPNSSICCSIRRAADACRISIADHGRDWVRSPFHSSHWPDDAEDGRRTAHHHALARQTEVFRRDNENIGVYIVGANRAERRPDPGSCE
jgi:anti-sigma regulatory factor (Ser/Thr protein kinase)